MSGGQLSPLDFIALSNKLGELYEFDDYANITLICGNEPITAVTFKDQPRADIAKDCLKWAINRGILVNFVACTLYARRKDPGYQSLLALVTTALPDALNLPANVQSDVYDVVSGISSLEALMTRDEVRQQIVSSRDRLAAISASINLLVIYKSLHDILHRLQTTPLATLLLAADKAVDDPVGSEMIAGHIEAANRALTDIGALLTQPESASLPDSYDQSWVDLLKQFADQCQDGLDSGKTIRIRMALQNINRILDGQSTQLNRLIFNAANKLPFADLTTTLQDVTKLDTGLATELNPAITAIGELRQTLLNRVTAHDRLQTVEYDLTYLADCLNAEDGHLILGQMAELWPKTRSNALSANALNPGPATYVLGQKEGDQVDACLLGIETSEADSSLTSQIPERIRELRKAFTMFRRKVGAFFFEVDSRLKSDFESTAQISGRLRVVVEATP
ncbi:hypothetical protein [Labrys neptuniae]